MRHLQRLQATRPSGLSITIGTNSKSETSKESRWQSGFGHCAAEACRFLSTLPGEAAERLARHLAVGLKVNQTTNSSVFFGLNPQDWIDIYFKYCFQQESNDSVSPILTKLQRTANSVCPEAENTAGPVKMKPVQNQETLRVNEEEEEIDVERVDEHDPMWRPW